MELKCIVEQVTAYPFALSSVGITDVGLVRRRNEDAWEGRASRGFYVLSDGMGGHQGGDIAAQETVAGLVGRCEEAVKPLPVEPVTLREAPRQVATWLRQAILEVNAQVHRLGRGDPALRGMGATLCCMLMSGRHVVYAHVGDSRIYRFREGHLHQLTEDHSLVTELLALGRISESQAQNFIYRHVITRAIGTRPAVEPDIGWEEAQEEDVYMMCSDGLTDLVDNQRLEELFRANGDLEKLACHIVEEALNAGGRDNVTVVLVRLYANYE